MGEVPQQCGVRFAVDNAHYLPIAGPSSASPFDEGLQVDLPVRYRSAPKTLLQLADCDFWPAEMHSDG